MDDSTSLVARIDGDFPGTAYWYRHPFWELAKDKVESMDGLKEVFARLGEDLQEQLILKPAQRFEQSFWRSKITAVKLYPTLTQSQTLDAGAAILGLMKEGFFRQDYNSYHKGKAAFRLWLRGTLNDVHLRELYRFYHTKVADRVWLWD